MLTIRQAKSEEEFQAARALIRAYVDGQRETYADLVHLVERFYAPVEEELTALPGPYAPPRGRLLVSYLDGQAAGVVAMRDHGQGRCLMQRMFVYPRFQRRGIGRALANRLIDEARAAGYETMWLDSAPRQLASHNLYRSLGFERIDPYFEMPADWPEEIKRDYLFMELSL